MLSFVGSHIQEDSFFSFLRVLDYITVRAALALAFSFLFCLILGPALIRFLRRLKAVQYIRKSDGENAVSLDEIHAGKAGTPSMGGVLMLGAVLGSILLFTDVSEPVVLMATFATLGFCAIGFRDDYLKISEQNSKGLSARGKLLAQCAVAGVFAVAYAWVFPSIVSYTPADGATVTGPEFLLFPFFKHLFFGLGLFYIPFAILVLTATSNAVNLTDGLDGLAAGVTISATICFAVVAYLAARTLDARYLIIPHVQGAGELAVLLASLAGACFGFLWFNSHPAEMFMGDTGSMMLGGLLGSVALLIKQEFLLILVGGVFVAEAGSVILQVGSYKLRRKRIFRMTPLHHHFEKCGIPESKIIARFWIVSALLALAGLVSLKIR